MEFPPASTRPRTSKLILPLSGSTLTCPPSVDHGVGPPVTAPVPVPTTPLVWAMPITDCQRSASPGSALAFCTTTAATTASADTNNDLKKNVCMNSSPNQVVIDTTNPRDHSKARTTSVPATPTGARGSSAV